MSPRGSIKARGDRKYLVVVGEGCGWVGAGGGRAGAGGGGGWFVLALGARFVRARGAGFVRFLGAAFVLRTLACGARTGGAGVRMGGGFWG